MTVIHVWRTHVGLSHASTSGNFVFYLRSDDADSCRLNSNADLPLARICRAVVVAGDDRLLPWLSRSLIPVQSTSTVANATCRGHLGRRHRW